VVKIVFEDLEGQTAEVNNGLASLEYRVKSDVPVGDYSITGTYLENDLYKSSEDSAVIRVRRRTVTALPSEIITNYHEVCQIEASVNYDTNVPVNEGIVEFSINDVAVGTANVVNGIATYTINDVLTSYKTGDTILAVYKGSNTYSVSASEVATLKIRKDVTIHIDNIIANRGSNANIQFRVTDSSDTLVDGVCNIIVDGNTVTSVTLNQQEVSYQYTISQNINKDILPVAIEYIQNNNYKSTNASAVINIRKPVTVTCNNASANAGEAVTLTVQIKDYHNVGVTGGQVDVSVGGGTTQPYSVGNDGIAMFQYTPPLSATGTINYTATYIQNDNYESGTSSISGIITIRKGVTIVVDDVTANIGDTIPLTARVTYGNNVPVNTGRVEFEIVAQN
jgi:opacity protein-like surface antigen